MKGSGLSLYHSNVLFHRWSKTFQTPISALTRVTHHWHPTKETSGQLEQLDAAGGPMYYSVKTLLLVQLAICSILHALLNRWFLCFL